MRDRDTPVHPKTGLTEASLAALGRYLGSSDTTEQDLAYASSVCRRAPEAKKRDKELAKIKDKTVELKQHNDEAAMLIDPQADRSKYQKWIIKIFNINSRKDVLGEFAKLERRVNQISEKVLKESNVNTAEAKRAILHPSDTTIQQGIGSSFVNGFQEIQRLHPYEGWIELSSANPQRGSFAIVYVGTLVKPGDLTNQVAVKKLLTVDGSPDKIAQVNRRGLREARIWSVLASYDHPNILPFYGVYFDATSAGTPLESRVMYLVSAWAKGGNIAGFLNQGNNRSVYAKKLLGDVILGLEVLHGGSPPHENTMGQDGPGRTQVYHGDLHPGNILIYKPEDDSCAPIAWLADFGISVGGPEAGTLLGALDYRAPELVDYLAQNTEERQGVTRKLEKGDVFSFGMLAYVMLTGSIPQKFRDEMLCRTPPETPKGMDGDLYALIQRCCTREAEFRPTVHEIRIECQNKKLLPFEEDANARAFQTEKVNGTLP